jgi:NADPH:quinone reductase-like Zn-dependent oxidoreductase
MDFAGVVETVGADVRSFRPGERVFGMLRWRELGAHAEYVCVPEAAYIAKMPAGATFEQAVVGEGAFYAYASLMQLGLKRGQRILIYGASGAIGTAAVQLARSLGADVTAVVATRHVELARSLGAASVIDYTAEDFTRIGETFDCVLDAVGKASYLRCRRLLKANGMFAATDVGPGGQTLLFAIGAFITGSKRVVTVLPRRVERFVDYLRERIEAGEFRAVIDRCYPLEAIADAYRYVEQGQKTGIVVVNVTPASDPRA